MWLSFRCSTCQLIRTAVESSSESWSTACRSRQPVYWRRCMSTLSACCTISTVTTSCSMCWSTVELRTAVALSHRSAAKCCHSVSTNSPGRSAVDFTLKTAVVEHSLCYCLSLVGWFCGSTHATTSLHQASLSCDTSTEFISPHSCQPADVVHVV